MSLDELAMTRRRSGECGLGTYKGLEHESKEQNVSVVRQARCGGWQSDGHRIAGRLGFEGTEAITADTRITMIRGREQGLCPLPQRQGP